MHLKPPSILLGCLNFSCPKTSTSLKNMSTSLSPWYSSLKNMSRHEEFVKSGETRKSNSKEPGNKDVIIVGAGVAGSALAYTLGKEGYQVRLIERNLAEPNRIVGELLQPGGYLKLVKLGLEDCVNEIDAQQVFGYALYKDGKSIRLPYPVENLSFRAAGRSFHHGRFIQRLRKKAASLANVRLEQGTVTSLIEGGGIIRGVQYKTKTGRCITTYAPLTIICDGCFSNLRRFLCKPKVDVLSNCIALILENCQLPYTNYAHVILEGSSFLMFYSISSTEVRCLIDVPGQKLPSNSNGEMKNYLKTIVVPQIPQELRNAFMSSLDKGDIRTMPISSMASVPYSIEGAILVGDALNMRHPLTGGGMMVALHDIVLLRDHLKPLHDLSDTTALTKCLQCFYNSRKPVAFVVNTTAGVAYKLICSEAKEETRKLLFDYFSLGQFFSRGAVAVLSGIELRPLTVAFYFSLMASYTAFRSLFLISSPERLWAVSRLALIRSTIIFHTVMDGVREMFR